MARGGRRAGRPGTAYPNRTDLNEAAPSKQYGTKVAQERAMAAVPVAPPPTPAPVAAAPGAGVGAPPLRPIDRPTDRPQEPLTHGLSSGPGPGPEALRLMSGDPSLDELRAIYQQFPTEQLRELIEDAE